jgi:hypothetical protein
MKRSILCLLAFAAAVSAQAQTPAARVGDVNVENGSSATIITGAFSVLIGP